MFQVLGRKTSNQGKAVLILKKQLRLVLLEDGDLYTMHISSFVLYLDPPKAAFWRHKNHQRVY